MKKLITLLLAAIMCLSLFACGSGTKVSEEQAEVERIGEYIVKYGSRDDSDEEVYTLTDKSLSDALGCVCSITYDAKEKVLTFSNFMPSDYSSVYTSMRYVPNIEMQNVDVISTSNGVDVTVLHCKVPTQRICEDESYVTEYVAEIVANDFEESKAQVICDSGVSLLFRMCQMPLSDAESDWVLLGFSEYEPLRVDLRAPLN